MGSNSAPKPKSHSLRDVTHCFFVSNDMRMFSGCAVRGGGGVEGRDRGVRGGGGLWDAGMG